MHILFRLIAVGLLLIPLWTSGCIEVAPPRPSETDTDVDDASPDSLTINLEEVEAQLDAALAELDDDDSDDTKPDDDESRDDDLIEEDETAIAEVDVDDGELVVDEDAPELEVIGINRHEGRHQHYLAIECHDPEVDNTRWVSAHRSRYSQHCNIDLSTAARAVTVEPEANIRLAPTPLGFRILGDFERGTYEVEIEAGLRSENGAVLHEKATRSIVVPEMSESLSFVADGRYLPQHAWEQLRIQHRNVDEVDVQLRHVPPENLSFWIAQSGEQTDETTSNLVVDTSIDLPDHEDETLTSSIELHEHLGEPRRGLYEMAVHSNDARATSRLQVTDINLIAKRHEPTPDAAWEDHIDVWAVDMTSTDPLANVQVKVLRPSGFTMAECRTNTEGHCRLDLPDHTVDSAAPVALVAERGRDLTYLKFDDVRIESGIDAADGPAFRDQKPYVATMYGDRDLYRPADDVHIAGALRDIDYTSPGAGIPVDVTVRDPENELVVERTIDTDDVGTFDTTFTLSDAAPTGRWTATMEVGTRELDTYSFHVEEFVPERMEVDVRPTREVFIGDERPTFEIKAQYLFGAGGTGSEVELDCRLVPVDSSPGGGEFQYGPLELENSREIIDLSRQNDVIGEDDTVEMSCPRLDRTPKGPMRVEATVAVAEGGSGRTTHGSADARFVPSETRVGLRTDADDLRGGEELNIEGHLVDVDGNLVDTDEILTLEFYNVRRQRSWQRTSSGRYTVQYDYQLILERAVDVEVHGGEFSVETIVADVDHAYLVRTEYDGAITGLDIDRRGRLWRFSGSRDRTPQPRTPSAVTLDTPDEIPIDDQTEIEFTSPFEGRALMTVETDRLVKREWIEASEGTNRWSFSVDTAEPNVYVGAFVIRDPHEVSDDAFEPQRAFGAVSVPVDRSRAETGLRMALDDEIRPGTTLEIELEATDIDAGQPAVATVAAVDEGILQLTNYQTPDPLDAVWNERAPGVDTFDTVGWATRLPPANPSSRTGGGAPEDRGEASEGRIMPFEPVALWSGPVDLDEQGRAIVRFDVPDYSGRLRVMSAVFSPDRMGAAEENVLVRDPLVVQATFPRQLTENDEAEIPVFLTNLSGARREIDVEVHAVPYDVEGFDATPDTDDEAVIEFPDGNTYTVELGVNESTILYVPARANQPGGGAEVTVEVSSDDITSSDSARIPLRPRGPTERRMFTSSLAPGPNDLTEHLDGWVPSSEETTLFISNIPQPDAFDHLEYLIRYPFGCAEQTLSSARPLVALSNLVQSIDPQFARSQREIDRRVDAGISRMLSMQHAHGGVGFWPHHRWSSRAYPSITAKTLDFFMQAVNQGYDVPRERIESAARWLARRVDASPDDAFEHYVLARAGEPETNKIREAIENLPENPEGRTKERTYLLKAALYLAGDRSYTDELKNPDFTTGDGGRSEGRFYSHRRQRAMMLHIFVELFGRDAAAERLAEHVTDDLVENEYGRLNTQETVWAIEALANWYEFEGLDEIDIELEGDGRIIHPDRTGGYPTWSIHRASEFEKLNLDVDYGDYDATLQLMLQSRGVRENPDVEIGGEGLLVNRTYLNENGDKIGDHEVTPGDVVYVHIELENDTGSRHRDLALVDRLPAGLDVENPKLGAAELPSWAEDSWGPDHVNVRDGRVEMFGDLGSSDSVEIVYPTRATMSGDFYVPAVEVEGMYDLDTWARGEEGRMTIESLPES